MVFFQKELEANKKFKWEDGGGLGEGMLGEKGGRQIKRGSDGDRDREQEREIENALMHMLRIL